MKKIIFILFLINTTTIVASYGQNFAPLGATWYYQIDEAFSTNQYYAKWEAVSDTIILGKQTRKVEKTYGNNGLLTATYMYVYEDSGIVYKYHAPSNSFTILYNFNAIANDSWVMKVDSCSLLITVDSTSITNINGYNLRVLYLSTSNNEFSGTVIERIGQLTTPLPDVSVLCYGWVVDAAYYNGLRCYSDNVFGSYNTNIAPSCNTIITGINSNNTLNPQIKVYPNPNQGNFYISYNIANLQQGLFILKDLSGREILRKNFSNTNNKININQKLSSGMYLYQLVVNGKVLGVDKLIITN